MEEAGNRLDLRSIPVEESLIHDWDMFLYEKLQHFKFLYNKRGSAAINVRDFTLIRTIGHGPYGRVVLATMKSNYKHYAIKILRKKQLVRYGQVKHAYSEKRVLQSILFPLAIRLEFFFQDNSYIYFVMPFIQGGDLFSLMRYIDLFKEEEAKFYAAQIILALEYLHHLGIVYRDIKPENVLLDKNGYIKLTDFGFAKLVGEKGRTYTMCGTPNYLAPELLLQGGYGKSVDWWSFGIVLYELCNGIAPFRGRNIAQLYNKIIVGVYKMPIHFTSELKHLIENILQVQVTKRLGCLKRGVAEIKEHPWFKKINWLEIINQRVEAPYLPNVISPIDDTLFDDYSNHKLVISNKNKFSHYFMNF